MRLPGRSQGCRCSTYHQKFPNQFAAPQRAMSRKTWRCWARLSARLPKGRITDPRVYCCPVRYCRKIARTGGRKLVQSLQSIKNVFEKPLVRVRDGLEQLAMSRKTLWLVKRMRRCMSMCFFTKFSSKWFHFFDTSFWLDSVYFGSGRFIAGSASLRRFLWF